MVLEAILHVVECEVVDSRGEVLVADAYSRDERENDVEGVAQAFCLLRALDALPFQLHAYKVSQRIDAAHGDNGPKLAIFDGTEQLADSLVLTPLLEVFEEDVSVEEYLHGCDRLEIVLLC